MTRTNRRIILLTCCLTASTVLWPADALAQRAVPRPPSRPIPGYARPGGHYGYGYPYYYPGHYYYSPFYFSFGWYGAGWYPWYVSAGYGYGYPGYGYGYPGYGYGYPGYGYGYGGYYQYPPPYPYYYPRYEAAVDLRIQIAQRNAEVYLDGYLVGRVDDFDGTFQRLRVPYGEHEVTVYLEGYQSIAQKMLFRPGESYKIAEAMRQLAPGQPNDPRPTPSAPPPDRGSPNPPPPERGEYVRPGGPPPERGGPPPARSEAFGTLSIRVQPADAEVLVDGEKWDSPQGEGRLMVELAEGTHRIEIRKPGFRTYTTTIRLRRGETLPLNVSLTSGGASAF